MEFLNRFTLTILVPVFVFIAILNVADTPPIQASDPDPNEGLEGIRVKEIDRGASKTVSWIRVRVSSSTPVDKTWTVIENVAEWDQFMGLLSRVETKSIEGLVGHYVLYIDPMWPIPDFETLVRIHRPPGSRSLLWWVKAKGRLSGSFGKISVGAEGEDSWLLFEWYGPPTNRFPDWMVKIGIGFIMPSLLKDIHEQILKQ